MATIRDLTKKEKKHIHKRVSKEFGRTRTAMVTDDSNFLYGDIVNRWDVIAGVELSCVSHDHDEYDELTRDEMIDAAIEYVLDMVRVRV